MLRFKLSIQFGVQGVERYSGLADSHEDGFVMLRILHPTFPC